MEDFEEFRAIQIKIDSALEIFEAKEESVTRDEDDDHPIIFEGTELPELQRYLIQLEYAFVRNTKLGMQSFFSYNHLSAIQRIFERTPN